MNKSLLLSGSLVLLSITSVPEPANAQTPQAAQPNQTTEVALSSLDLSRALQTWGRPGKDANVARKPLRIGGQSFENGFGTHSFSRLFVHLDGRASRFTAAVGIDDSAGKEGSVEFKVSGDGKLLWSSGVVRAGAAARPVSLDVSGTRYLTLEVTRPLAKVSESEFIVVESGNQIEAQREALAPVAIALG